MRLKNASTTLSHIPHHSMRCTISRVAVRAGTAPPSIPTSANSSVLTTNSPRFTAIPASETMMSPLRNWRYLRGLTGTGFAAPNGGPDPPQQKRDDQRHQGVDVLERI